MKAKKANASKRNLKTNKKPPPQKSNLNHLENTSTSSQDFFKASPMTS